MTDQRPTLADALARSEKHKFSGYSLFLGGGGRVTSRDDAIRFTFGVALGGVYRSVKYTFPFAIVGVVNVVTSPPSASAPFMEVL